MKEKKKKAALNKMRTIYIKQTGVSLALPGQETGRTLYGKTGKLQGNNDRFLASLGKFKDSTKIAYMTKK